MQFRASRLTVAALAAALAASACGAAAKSHASGPATTHSHPAAPRPSAAQIAQRRVDGMVLVAGSLPGYTLHSRGSETLKEQLPPKRAKHFAQLTRLVTASWLASAHTFTVSPDGKLYVFSDANLFRSSAAAERIGRLEDQPDPHPGTHTRFLQPPSGAPAGSRFEFSSGPKLSGFELGWTQGPVIAFVVVYGHPHEHFTHVEQRRIGIYLAAAANAQAARIAHVEALGATSA